MARLLSKAVYRANAPISTVPAPCAASGGAAASEAAATNRMARVIMRILLACALRGNENHTIGRPRAVDAGRSRVFQDLDAGDVRRRETRERAAERPGRDRDTVDDEQRIVVPRVAADAAVAADAELITAVGQPGDVEARHAPQHLLHLRHAGVGLAGHHGGHGAGGGRGCLFRPRRGAPAAERDGNHESEAAPRVPGSVPRVLLGQRVPVQLIPGNRHVVHAYASKVVARAQHARLVAPRPLLDSIDLVAVVRPRRPVEPVGTGKGDVDARGGLTQDLGGGDPAAPREEAAVFGGHLPASPLAVPGAPAPAAAQGLLAVRTGE